MSSARRSYILWLILIALALVAVAAVLSRLGWIPIGDRGRFGLIVLFILLPTFAWWTWVHYLLGEIRGQADRSAPIRVSRAMVAIYAISVLLPAGFAAAGVNLLHHLHPAPLMWLLAWHLMMALVGMGLLLGVPAVLLDRFVRWTRTTKSKAPPLPAPSSSEDTMADNAPLISRRGVLTAAVASAPIVIAGGSTALGMYQNGRFDVRRIKMKLPRLPDRLKGLTITQISDVHLGRLIRPHHLPPMIDAVNRLDSDIVVVTGDILDFNTEFLPEAGDMLAQLEHRYGRFSVIGNHDLYHAPDVVVSYLSDIEPGFLIDRHVRLDIDGEPLQIAGLFWSARTQSRPDRPGHAERAENALRGADPNGCTIMLAHHPHAFDTLAERRVDLTLAGHTHGGQIMFTRQGAKRPIGPGNIFRYIWGKYRIGQSQMYVNAGVGNWFPFRLNAPAEIVQIQLV